MVAASDILERFQKYRNELVRATAYSILESTIQFFSDGKKDLPEAHASGLLLTLDDRFFMVTAAHVIADNYEQIYIILPDQELQLGGKLHFTPLPESGKRIDDKIDIAVMELEENVVVDILDGGFKFITRSNIGISHGNASLPYYLSVGYPVTKTKKVWGKPELKSEPFVYQTEPNINFNYAQHGFMPASHIAIEFDGKVRSESNTNLHAAPQLHGISGSGLWYLKDFAKPSMVSAKQLVGVIIEGVDKHHNKALIATRIDVVTELIRQRFGLNIPQSSTIKVNLL